MSQKKPQTTAVVKWEDELARQAEIASSMEASAAGGQFFSVKGGTLSWQNSPLVGNQMAVIILDSILENVFYEGHYNPEVPQSPTCFAFGRDDKTMKPHQIVVDAGNDQHPFCAGCALNEFGTADLGKGKACRNTRRIGMIVAGTLLESGKFEFNDSVEHYENTAVGFMKLPVTSVKGYASFVTQVAGALRRPPLGIVTKVKIVPDAKNQFKIVFEPLMSLPDELMGVIMKRNEEVKSTIEFPYQVNEKEEEVKPKSNRPAVKTGGKKPARKY